MRAGVLFPLLGAFFSFASLVLLLFTLIGSIQPHAVLKDIYFLKLNTANISTDVVPSLSNNTASKAALLNQYEFVTIGLWGYCHSNSTEVIGCSKPSAHYHFALVDVIYSALGVWTSVSAPGNLADNDSKIQTMSKTALALFIAAIALTLVSFILCVVSIKKHRLIRTIAALVSFLAFVLALIAPALALAVYLYIKDQFNNNNSSVVASIGRTGMGIAWGAALASLLAFTFSSIAICTASRDVRSTTPEKQPFLHEDVPLNPEISMYQPSAVTPYGAGHQAPDMFANHGHMANTTTEPQFIQPTYYGHH